MEPPFLHSRVICGDISLVDARPVVRDEIARYSLYIDDYKRIRASLTSPWLECRGNDTSHHDHVALGVPYVQE
ncbi:hypothetical protein GCM10007874_46120 [Labrys miyagiensis]|uniref:Uncharacterized protein n=1 Tax=Labrys miyagiensis TaxID=346912 RepID=A0ABQ6CRM6_9HYPH|nr:hypothetical protein GCM10007874_46120 [Labrys miyagiensis]